MSQNFSAALHIMMLHNKYQIPGGEDVSTKTELALLKQAGHQVTLIEENNNKILGFSQLQKLKLLINSSWDYEQHRRIKYLIKDLKPNLLHVQNFFPLFSPSVHSAGQSLNIPTIQHLRNFRLGCLNAYLFREGKICEVCVKKNPWRGILNRCYQNSFAASLGIWNMITYNRFRKTWLQDVSAFIAPSHFAAQKFIEIGIPENRLFVKPNVTHDPLDGQSITPLPEHPNFLFIGRLSPEKGVKTLLQAWEKLAEIDWKLNIIGNGQQKEELEIYVKEHNLHNVNFQGYQSRDQVFAEIQKSTVVVVPSQWYETFGRVVIEAFACGRSVIVSNLGALIELVTEGKTGFLVNPTDIDAWVERLNWYGKNNLDVSRMNQKCRQNYLEKYTLAQNYKQLINIYNQFC